MKGCHKENLRHTLGNIHEFSERFQQLDVDLFFSIWYTHKEKMSIHSKIRCAK